MYFVPLCVPWQAPTRALGSRNPRPYRVCEIRKWRRMFVGEDRSTPQNLEMCEVSAHRLPCACACRSLSSQYVTYEIVQLAPLGGYHSSRFRSFAGSSSSSPGSVNRLQTAQRPSEIGSKSWTLSRSLICKIDMCMYAHQTLPMRKSDGFLFFHMRPCFHSFIRVSRETKTAK